MHNDCRKGYDIERKKVGPTIEDYLSTGSQIPTQESPTHRDHGTTVDPNRH